MNEKKFIPALTGIRAICVYFIFFYHLNIFSPILHPILFAVLNEGYCFVSFFFVLSGFLIYYKNSDIGTANKTSIYNYFVNRIARVYPVLFILISATFFTGFYHHYYSGQETIKLYLLNITLLKGFSSTYWLTGIGPSWFLSVLELFYLLSPLIFLYVKNAGSLIKIVVFFYAAGLLLTLFFHYFPFGGLFSDLLFTAYTTFFGRVFEFACGIFLGMIVKGEINSRFIKLIGNQTLYVGLFIIIVSITFLYLIATYNHLFYARYSWMGLAVNNILLPVGITILFYNLIYYKSLFQIFLSSKIMVNLGNATYCFYLLHTTFVLSYIFKFISTNIFIAFICMIIISFIFHKLVELPLTLFVRKKLHKKQPIVF